MLRDGRAPRRALVSARWTVAPPRGRGHRANRGIRAPRYTIPVLDMKAAVYRGAGDLRIEDVPVPEVGPGEMLVRVDACGVCGTDIKKIQKGLLPGPRIFGHEIAGTVAAGAAVAAASARATGWCCTTTSPAGPASTASAGPTRSARPTSATAPPPASRPPAAGSPSTSRRCDWIVERGAIADPGRRAARGGRLRGAREHLPEGGAQGGRGRRARRCWWWARARSACC